MKSKSTAEVSTSLCTRLIVSLFIKWNQQPLQKQLLSLIPQNSRHENTAPKSPKELSIFTPHPDSFNAEQPPHSVARPQPLEVRVKITFHSVSKALSCEGLHSHVFSACSTVGGLIPICLWFSSGCLFFFFFFLFAQHCFKHWADQRGVTHKDMYSISVCPSNLVLLLLSAFGCY